MAASLGGRSAPAEFQAQCEGRASRARALLPSAKARGEQRSSELRAVMDELTAVRGAAVQSGLLLSAQADGQTVDALLHEARQRVQQAQLHVDAASSEVGG